MSREMEQDADLNWAINVLSGGGDENDSSNHAEWMIQYIAEHGESDIIRFKAQAMSQIRPIP